MIRRKRVHPRDAWWEPAIRVTLTSTTMGMIVGLDAPTAGTVRVNGCSCRAFEALILFVALVAYATVTTRDIQHPTRPTRTAAGAWCPNRPRAEGVGHTSFKSSPVSMETCTSRKLASQSWPCWPACPRHRRWGGCNADDACVAATRHGRAIA
jgi:hypothetical protein